MAIEPHVQHHWITKMKTHLAWEESDSESTVDFCRLGSPSHRRGRFSRRKEDIWRFALPLIKTFHTFSLFVLPFNKLYTGRGLIIVNSHSKYLSDSKWTSFSEGWGYFEWRCVPIITIRPILGSPRSKSATAGTAIVPDLFHPPFL